MLKEENMAEKSVILGELKVLGNVTGKNIKTIQRDVNSLSQSLSTVSTKQADYFRGIADDAIITPTEKNTLRKEWNTIQNTYSAVMKLAEDKQVITTNEIQNYKTAYENLYTYLFITLKVFDDMTSNTTLESAEDFNSVYEEYYRTETYAQNRCAAGNDYWTLRILDNLDVVGTSNEVALYNGKFYKYSVEKARWEEVNTAQYLGCHEDFPLEANIDDYFLMLSDTVERALRVTEDGVLADNDGKTIVFTWDVAEGNLYLMTSTGWMEVLDRNDWRYVVAQNDLIAHNYELSPALKDFLEQEIKKAGKASYLGAILTTPEDYINGDWFTWASSQETVWHYGDYEVTLKKGHVYKFNDPTWTELDPADSRYNSEFMEALNDIVDLNMGTDGYFNNLFVRKIFSMQAVINELQTKVIELSTGGCIKSTGYIKGTSDKGFYLGFDGYFECVNAIMRGIQITGNSLFEGEIISGPLELTNKTPTGRVYTYPAGTYIKDIVIDSRNPYEGVYVITNHSSVPTVYNFDNLSFSNEYIGVIERRDWYRSTFKLFYRGKEVYNRVTEQMGELQELIGNISFTYNQSGDEKTFKLKNLPDTEPSEHDIVWNDHGILKIT